MMPALKGSNPSQSSVIDIGIERGLDCSNGVLRTPKPTAVNDSAAAIPSAAASTRTTW